MPNLGSTSFSSATLAAATVLIAGVAWFALAPLPAPPTEVERSLSEDNAPPAEGAEAPAPLGDSPEPATPQEDESPPLDGPLRPDEGDSADEAATPAERLRQALMTLHQGELTKEPAPSQAPADKAALTEYTRQMTENHLLPLVSECYAALLDRNPSAAGKLTLEFALLGTAELGAVIVDIAVAASGALHETRFTGCVKSRANEVVFPAPPNGHKVVTATQSLDLAP